MSRSPGFWRDTAAASTVEFVMVLPLFLLFVFGAIDVGGFAWRLNTAEKATQMGARMAVVTNPVAQGLVTEEYLGRNVNPADANSPVLGQGDAIPVAALGLIQCTQGATCTCKTGPCVTDMQADTAAFQAIFARMAKVDPQITAGQVTVEYRGSGLGFAGDPDGMEIAPLVTVRLVGARYAPIMGVLFNGSLNLPDFAYSLTMEDGDGTTSN
ncbi:pilus assembly protein [Novosphingobium sp. KCTC 2891]|uniref:TadE family protein n=1 Tax=Novosphingobium sp. KCTC 2891 TaxID=2989730 RepID=UPI002221828E|nr:TadE family protein [Novosphingobium sp. KCTC 2891]MCW1381600.1 pilus assembly protein [Novosphingobium sp. KCTC 2891]